MLSLLLLAGLAFSLVGGPVDGPLGRTQSPLWANQAPNPPDKTAFVAGELNDEELLTFTASLQAASPRSVVLLDSLATTTYTRAFLSAYRPDRVVPVGTFSEGIVDLERRLKVKTRPALSLQRGSEQSLWKALFPRADRVVVCPAQPRSVLLHAACLAGMVKAPLFVTHGKPGEPGDLKQWLARWKTREVFAVGAARAVCVDLKDVNVVRLAGEKAVAEAYLRRLLKAGPVNTLVVANPEDTDGKGGMSALAPWVAVQKRAALLLTNKKGDNVADVVRAAATTRKPLRRADALILVAGLEAIPVRQRPNPIPSDKDQTIEMEPLTPKGNEPFSFAVGRLFGDEAAVVVLQLARQRLLAPARAPRRAVVASNSGGGLPLLETFSRITAKELDNAGYQTKTLFGKDCTKDDLRRYMAHSDLFLWEGHHNTLICDWSMPDWDEAMPPSLVFLQSCLALKESKAQPLLRRGAIGVIGSSTRTYSASGGACSLAFFDALLYEDQSLGGSLRHAKNFLLAYSLLKEKRLGKSAKRSGANLRSAWAFTLWGDPTVKLPRPERPKDGLPAVKHEVKGNTIVLRLPEERHDEVKSAKYRAQPAANSRRAGLVRRDKDDDAKRLVPFVFAEVKLAKVPHGKVPHLTSKLPSKDYVFCWDARRQCGYLLATPGAHDRKELRFHVTWKAAPGTESARAEGAAGQ
jgi:hypothetical protein